MKPIVYVLGSILLALTIFLVILILKQTGKDKSLSGTITGGSSETFFGKAGGDSKDKLLSTLTIIGSVLFVAITVALTVILL